MIRPLKLASYLLNDTSLCIHVHACIHAHAAKQLQRTKQYKTIQIHILLGCWSTRTTSFILKLMWLTFFFFFKAYSNYPAKSERTLNQHIIVSKQQVYWMPWPWLVSFSALYDRILFYHVSYHIIPYRNFLLLQQVLAVKLTADFFSLICFLFFCSWCTV